MSNLFKCNLAAGRKQIGLWITLDSLNATEIAAGAGYDWLLLDLEHSCIDLAQVIQHLRAARGGTAEMVIRIPSNEPVIFKRLLDAGVRSFMVPMVQTAGDAQHAVSATRYFPKGIRGMAGNQRASNFGRNLAYLETCEQDQCLIAQIESPKAIEAIEDISAVDGIDALFIGPNDLATNMGMLGKTDNAGVKSAIASAITRINATGKASGILNFVPSEARELLRDGVGFVAVGADSGILARRTEALLNEIKSGL